MVRVFVSYSSSNRPAVESLASDLVRLGHQVWFDQALKGGQDWWDAILEQVRTCDVLMFGVSEDSLDSEACQRELAYARALHRPIIPALLSGDVAPSRLPTALQRKQCIDLTGDPKEGLLNLAAALNDLGELRPLPAELPRPPEIPLSPLASIAEQLTQKALSEQQQVLIVHELKKLATRRDTRDDAFELIQLLLGHTALLASVEQEIEQFLAGVESPEPAVGSPSHATSGHIRAGRGTAYIRVQRKKTMLNHRFNAYDVFLDGTKVARLRNGENCQLSVVPGVHAVQVKLGTYDFLDRYNLAAKSQELAVSVGDSETVSLICAPKPVTGGLKLKREKP